MRRGTIKLTGPDGYAVFHEFELAGDVGVESKPVDRLGQARGPIRRYDSWREFADGLSADIGNEIRAMLGVGDHDE
jgi:hypothetical protein